VSCLWYYVVCSSCFRGSPTRTSQYNSPGPTFWFSCVACFSKLCLHTDDTLSLFDDTTVTLGKTVRKFQHSTCEHYHTTKLLQEYATQGRCKAALSAKQGLLSKQKGKGKSSGPKVKKVNLQTYKYHALGDYPSTIWCMGTTDNYSTQMVSNMMNFWISA